MEKRNRFQGLIMALFIMCMAIALVSSVMYFWHMNGQANPPKVAALFIAIAAVFCAGPLARFVGLRLRTVNKRGKAIMEALAFMTILTVGTCLRYIAIKAIPLEPSSDFASYYRIGEQLSNGTTLGGGAMGYGGYVAQFPHVIGYPMLLLKPVFSVLGASVQNALAANLALGMGSVVLIYWLARRVGGRFIGLAAMTVMSLWPSHILYGTLVAAEPLFTFLILLATVFALAGIMRDEHSLFKRAPHLAVAALALGGVLLGIASAVRPMALILVIALCMALLMMRNKDETRNDKAVRRFLDRGLLCSLVVLVSFFASSGVMSYQVARRIEMKPVSGLTASGYSMMVGMNASSGGVWNEADAVFFGDLFRETGSADAAHRKALERGLARIADKPLDTVGLMIVKFIALWSGDDFAVDWNLAMANEQGVLTDGMAQALRMIRLIGSAMYVCLLLMCFCGAYGLFRRKGKPQAADCVCMLFFLGTAFLHMILETQVRYHYNMLPYLILLATMAPKQRKNGVKE